MAASHTRAAAAVSWAALRGSPRAASAVRRAGAPSSTMNWANDSLFSGAVTRGECVSAHRWPARSGYITHERSVKSSGVSWLLLGAAAAAGASAAATVASCESKTEDGRAEGGAGREEPRTLTREERAAQFDVHAACSHAEVFEDLASVTRDGQRFMTVRDFMKSRLYRHVWYDGTLHTKERFACEDKLGDDDGLISFTEFLFLSTVLAVPEDHIAVGFLMVDVDGNGRVDPSELAEAVRLLADREKSAMPSVSEQGRALQSDSGALGSRFLKTVFGRSKAVSFKEFRSVLQSLKQDLLKLEFKHYANGDDVLFHREFGKFLIAHVNPANLSKFEARVDDLPAIRGSGFNFQEFVDLNKVFCDYADDFHMAIDMLAAADDGCTQLEFRRAAEAAAGVNLSRRMTSIVFEIFDSDGNGRLDTKELFTAIHARTDDVIGQPRKKLSKLGFFLECLSSGSN